MDIRVVETYDPFCNHPSGGVNVIIDDRWAAFFPKESKDQALFLVDRINFAQNMRMGNDHE